MSWAFRRWNAGEASTTTKLFGAQQGLVLSAEQKALKLMDISAGPQITLADVR